MKKYLNLTLVLFFILSGVVLVTAEPSVGNVTKTIITSDQMSYDYKRSIAIFQDNVVVVDPQVRLEADALTVLFGSTNEVKSVTAIGSVRIKSGDKSATCNKAIYIIRTGEILLTGNAKLMRNSDALEGKQITFWVNEERVVCKPGKLTIHPSRGGDSGGTDIFDLGSGNK